MHVVQVSANEGGKVCWFDELEVLQASSMYCWYLLMQIIVLPVDAMSHASSSFRVAFLVG